MSPANVTVCVPVYNTARYIKVCVESVFAQDYADWRLLVADNHSTDGTWEILSSLNHPQLQLFRHPQNLGATANWNFSLRQVQTEFVCFLGADDLFYPHHLSRKIALLQQTPAAPFIHGLADVIDTDGAPFQPTPPSGWRRAWCHLLKSLRSLRGKKIS